MVDLANLTIGLKGIQRNCWSASNIVRRVSAAGWCRFGTPVMINVIEAAALAAVEHLLPAGHQSLGIHLDVRHFAATPIGMRIRATAELIAVDGRTLSFQVEAHDEKERIGDGAHERCGRQRRSFAISACKRNSARNPDALVGEQTTPAPPLFTPPSFPLTPGVILRESGGSSNP